MSDIRLKRVTVDASTLDIVGGNVYVYNTNETTSPATGSIVTLGGIGIGHTNPATSPSNGGALTVKGGIGIAKNMFIDGNVSQEALTSTFTVKGTVLPRLLVESESTSLIRLAPNGVNAMLTASASNVTVNSTATSTNASTGGLVVAGGLGVMSSQNATSFTSASAINVEGSVIAKQNLFSRQVYVNGDGTTASLTLGPLDHATSGNKSAVIQSVTAAGSSGSTLEFSTHAVSANSSSNLALSIDTSQNTRIHSTTESVSTTSGSFTVSGGLGVAKNVYIGGNVRVLDSVNASSVSSAPVVVSGGMGVAKDTYIGGQLNVAGNTELQGVLGLNEQSTLANKLTLFQTSGNLAEQTQFSGFGITGTSDLAYQVPASSKHVFSVSTSESLTFSQSGVEFPGTSQRYRVRGDGSGTTGLSFESASAGQASSIEFYTFDGDSTDNNTLAIYNRGTSTSNATSESLSIGWDSANTKHSIKTAKTGSGVQRPLSIEAGTANQILLSTNGNVSMTGALNSASFAAGTLRSTSGSLVLDGMTISNLVSGTTVHNLFITSAGNATSLTVSSGVPKLSLQNVSGANSEALEFAANTAGATISTTQSGSGQLRSLLLGNTLFLATNGNVSINSTAANTANLFVAGDLNVTGGVTIGNLAISVVSASSTAESVSTTTGSVIGYGGLGIVKRANIGGITSVFSTEANSINTLGGITVVKDAVITGGMSVGAVVMSNATCANLAVVSTADALSTSSGALIVSGGVGISKSLYVQNASVFNSSVSTLHSLRLKDASSIDRFSIQQDNTVFTVSRYNQTGTLLDSCLSIEITTGNLELTKSATIQQTLTVRSTIDAVNATSNGAIVTLGGIAISKSATVGQALTVKSTTDSTSINDGALVVDGGAGIKKNLHVGGTATITGNLIVNGTTTTINSSVTELVDNMIVVNSGASGSRDAGVLFSRFQANNDTGLGDVVADATYVLDTIPDQTGVLITQVKFSSSANATDDYYTNWYIKISSGFSSNQVRKITAYTGASRTATVAAWTSQGPAISDTVNLYYKPLVGLFYNELDDIFQFGACAQDPGASVVNTTEIMGIRSGRALVTSTVVSTNASSGALVVTGGIGIRSTADATSNTVGGSLTTLGGVAIAKNLFVGGTFTVNGTQISKGLNTVTFTGANNQVSPANVVLLSSSLFGVDLFMSVRVVATASIYTNFHLRTVNKSSTWELVSTYVGDDSGIVFSITSGGQVQYTSPSFPGFTSLTMRYSVVEN